jgi:excisionase family DNA binding protein
VVEALAMSASAVHDFPQVTRFTPYDDLPERLFVQEAVTYTGLSKDTIYKQVREGKLKNVGVGKIIQIPKECFDPSRSQQVTQ